MAEFDPSGSIFLPHDGLEDFERMELALMLKRAPFDYELTPQDQLQLYDELRQVRAWWFGKGTLALLDK